MNIISYLSNFAARKLTAFAVAVALSLLTTAQGAVVEAASMARADVGAAVALAQPGDTVIVPAGTADWTNDLYVTNSITISFAGIGQSIILDDIVAIQGGNPSYTAAVIALQPSNTNVLARITGLQIDKGTNSAGQLSNPYEKGALQVLGNTCNARIDHCLLTNVNDDNIYIYNAACPLIDHCSFYTTNYNVHFIVIQHDAWAGGSWGDGAWTNPAPIGTSNAAFIESCNLTGPGPGASFCAVDAFDGAHYVFRYNNVTNTWITCHGTESTAFYRGTRSMEVYGNYASNPNWQFFMEWRSGTGVMFSNTTVGYKEFAQLSHYRSSTAYLYWGGLTGTNVLDDNPATNLIAPSLTVIAAGGSGQQTLVVTNLLVANAYAGWSAVDLNTSTNTTFFGGCYANGSNAFYFLASGDGRPAIVFNRGDTVSLYQPAICGIDMTGTGLSGVLSRSNGIPNGVWPTNAVEPIYAWGNTISSIYTTNPGLMAQNAIILAGVHYSNSLAAPPGYVPFTYPHPLAAGGATLLPPVNFRTGP